jgi:phage shock protein PspC (stress-responsive transcriptional regulator)
MSARLSRPRDDRWIAGVCSGLGRRFGMSSNTVRLLFLLSCLLPGPQVLIYLALWIVMPSEGRYPAHA